MHLHRKLADIVATHNVKLVVFTLCKVCKLLTL